MLNQSVILYRKPNPEELRKQQIEKEIENIQVDAQVINELQNNFGDIEIDDAKRIIYEVTQEMLEKLKVFHYRYRLNNPISFSKTVFSFNFFKIDMKTKIKESDLANEASKTTAKKSKN